MVARAAAAVRRARVNPLGFMVGEHVGSYVGRWVQIIERPTRFGDDLAQAAMLRAMADRGQLTRDGNDRSAAIGGGIGRGLVGCCWRSRAGATVANMYYSQPLLHTLGRAFHVSNATAGLMFTIGQIGFVFGLAFLVPLGDLLERRGLIATRCW